MLRNLPVDWSEEGRGKGEGERGGGKGWGKGWGSGSDTGEKERQVRIGDGMRREGMRRGIGAYGLNSRKGRIGKTRPGVVDGPGSYAAVRGVHKGSTRVYIWLGVWEWVVCDQTTFSMKLECS
jgi:hypothetical protein